MLVSPPNQRRLMLRDPGGRRVPSPLLVAALCACGLPSLGQEGSGIAPKFLFDPGHPETVEMTSDGGDVTMTPSGGGIDVLIKGGPQDYPGFAIKPAGGRAWDLSPWGHVEARVTNTAKEGAKLNVNLRVDNDGPWQDNPWNCEGVWLKPGESRVIKVIFGYQYGLKPGYKLKPDAVTRLLVFSNKSATDRTFRIEDIQAAGAAGEKPPVDPNSVVVVPAGGVILGKGVAPDLARSVEGKGGAVGKLLDTGALAVEFGGTAQQSVSVKPAAGVWNLGAHHEVKLTLRNAGSTHITPSVRVESKGGATDTVTAPVPLAPGAETTLSVSFVPAKPWVGTPVIKGAYNGAVPGTGTSFESSRVSGVSVLSDKTAGVRRVEVLSIVADAAPATVPEWLGRRPPVAGDWVQTMDENFDGDAIDLKRWNIYTDNFWDKRTHFTRDNTIVADGKLVLRYEKKTGYQNDNPAESNGVGKTDFACGFADTYGKWVQRYGYFEARMKLPRCPGLWPAFWMMPDRGVAEGPQWKRASTSNGGMEFDIMEHLTGWGPYRFNLALHWDGYGKEHKAVGTSNVYVPADKDGYITVGLLWTPGSAVFYGNGSEIGRWENERVCSVPSYPILYMVSGGWANVPLDATKLPDDFVIDYVRVWQRKDLASPEDGPKPNDGRPKSQ